MRLLGGHSCDERSRCPEGHLHVAPGEAMLPPGFRHDGDGALGNGGRGFTPGSWSPASVWVLSAVPQSGPLVLGEGQSLVR